VRDLVWRVPAIAACVWLCVGTYTAIENQPLVVQIPLTVSTMWWGSLAVLLVDIKIQIS